MKKSYFRDLYYSISIKPKLILIIGLLVIYPMFLIGYLGYHSYERIMTDKFTAYAHTNVKELSTLVSNRINSLHEFSMDILYDNQLYEARDQLYENQNDILLDLTIQKQLREYFGSIILSRPEIDLIGFRFTDHDTVYMAKKALTHENAVDIPIDDIYAKAKGESQLIYYLQKNGDEAKTIYFARIIYDRNTLEELGLIIFKINKDYLFGLLRDFLKNPAENVFVHTNQLDELFHLHENQLNYTDELKDLLITNKPDGIYPLQDNYIIYDTIQPVNWKISVIISSDMLLKEVRHLSKIILLLCISTIPILIILINLLYGDIIKPTTLLIHKMQEIESGQMGVTLDIRRKDEIGYLFASFNRMSQEIKNLINYVYKEEIALKNAEIKALQSQINPHFLYNTLETINWKAQLSGVDEISDMITALSDIMETNIDRENERFIPLYKEINYIDNYNFLIQKRFGKKIQFKKLIDPPAYDLEIPKLIIQPLIENAIYHGIEPKGKGTVRLDIILLENKLKIQVIDDGIGIDEKTLEELNMNLAYHENLSINADIYGKSKIGIINVHRRIQLIYGKSYGLIIQSTLGEGTVIALTIPIHLY